MAQSSAADTQTLRSEDEQLQEPLCCPPLLGPTLDDEAADELAATLKSLADPVRLKLINLIAGSGEVCACDLPALLNRKQPTISHHLSILVKAGLLDREQRGKWAWFRFNRDRLTELCAALGVTDCAGGS
ncbi:MAG: metalloregulator ArsR/SmtB family transcription factor [Acidimicrobiales bacterium]